jgi:hypothetical protein
MQFDIHERAWFLIDEVRVAGISQEEREWLRGHIAECAACARHDETTARIVRALGEFTVGQSSDLPRPVWADRKSRLRAVPAAPRWPIAAAAMLLIAAACLYTPAPHARQERDDALLLERVESRVSRTVPEAMEPLLQAQIGETR